ncbi:MAG: O-antigen ligase family protein [Bacteroidota bacterium]
MNQLRKSELIWFYSLSAFFAACVIFFLSKEMYLAAAFPVAIAIVLVALFALDYVLLGVAFFTPIAIVLNDKSDGPAISIPTEPLLFGALLLGIFKLVARGGIDRKVAYHPVSLSIGAMLVWKAFTCLTSSMPMVSIKHFLAQLWFIIPFYVLGTQLFRDTRNIHRFVWLYVSSLLIVIGYTLYEHADHGWTQEAAHWVMYPFYNDHTAYAAAIAMFIPPIIALMVLPKSKSYEKPLSGIILGILIIAIIFSYTRAAWISLIMALTCFVIYYFRIRFWKVAVTGITLLSIFLAFQSDIFMKLEKNRQDSATDINKHLQSISNISTDASNLERINRWNSAFRMWKERPVFGWGPGTYQFNYAPFQKSDEMTIISTNAGNRGNAHSEYIGPLAESGVLGMVLMILLVVVTLYQSTLAFSKTTDNNTRKYILGILLGLITYFSHGMLNNFLDTDKLSVPFWAFMAMLVSLDVYHRSDQKNEILEN